MSDTPKNEQYNGAEHIADILSRVMTPQESGDAEILRTVAEYSLQLTPDQQRTMLMLYSFAENEKVPSKERVMIINFLENYKVLKRYHDTLIPMVKLSEGLALKRFWSNESMKANVMKGQ